MSRKDGEGPSGVRWVMVVVMGWRVEGVQSPLIPSARLGSVCALSHILYL